MIEIIINNKRVIVIVGIIILLIGVFCSLFYWDIYIDRKNNELDDDVQAYFYGTVGGKGGWFSYSGDINNFTYSLVDLIGPLSDEHEFYKADTFSSEDGSISGRIVFRAEKRFDDNDGTEKWYILEVDNVGYINEIFKILIISGILIILFPYLLLILNNIYIRQKKLSKILKRKSIIQEEVATIQEKSINSGLSNSDKNKIDSLYLEVEMLKNERQNTSDSQTIIEITKLFETISKMKSDVKVHGDYINGSKTKIEDSVVSRSNIGVSSTVEELERLGSMKEKGLLTDEQFEVAKEKLLKK